jgi:tricorn protease
MIVNELAGSGGDMMPWMFRYTKTGPLVGKRTWGGLFGVLGFPELMDGGTVTAPNVRIFSPQGEWVAENTGVTPDVEVELDPKSVAAGHDPQLERAVAMALAALQKNPPAEARPPASPDYQHTGSSGAAQ